MNQIATKQNEPYALQLLAAQRHLYWRAKRLLGLQLSLVGPIATLGAIAAIILPEGKEIVALAGVLVFFTDLFWLTPHQKRLREAAAKIQEKFDCDVLGLTWDSIRVGNPEPAELVVEQAKRYERRASGMSPLTDWYPPTIAVLPLPLARIVCQRANCWWDAKQRRGYASVVAGLLFVCFLCVLIGGVTAKLSVADLILVVVVPMLSTIKVGHQQWTEHRQAADGLDRLREQMEKVWKDALGDPASPLLGAVARSLQGEIFDARKRNPLLFDFVFNRVRNSQNEQMNEGASRFIIEAQEAGLNSLSPTPRTVIG